MTTDALKRFERALLPQTWAEVRPLVPRELLSGVSLRTALVRHLISLRDADAGLDTSPGPGIDMDLASRLADCCRSLLAVAEQTDDRAVSATVQAAVRYFVMSADDADDYEPAHGLEDDQLVLAAAAVAIGRPDLVEPP